MFDKIQRCFDFINLCQRYWTVVRSIEKIIILILILLFQSDRTKLEIKMRNVSEMIKSEYGCSIQQNLIRSA